MDDLNEWPKTIQIGGEQYEVTPEMSMTEMAAVQQAVMNELRPLIELQDAMGGDVDEDVRETFGLTGTGDEQDR